MSSVQFPSSNKVPNEAGSPTTTFECWVNRVKLALFRGGGNKHPHRNHESFVQQPILLLANQHPFRPADICQCPNNPVGEFEQPMNEPCEEWPLHWVDDLRT